MLRRRKLPNLGVSAGELDECQVSSVSLRVRSRPDSGFGRNSHPTAAATLSCTKTPGSITQLGKRDWEWKRQVRMENVQTVRHRDGFLLSSIRHIQETANQSHKPKHVLHFGRT